MKALVTGASGFVGTSLVRRLLENPEVEQLVLVDREVSSIPDDDRVQSVSGDLAEPQVLAQAFESGPDVIFHLASIPGGLAEKNFELGLRVNLEGSIRLLETARSRGRVPRFVFASSIAVYGVPLPRSIDETTAAEPGLTYGSHKRAIELLVCDYSRRGYIEGCALRLPGIVARPTQPAGLISAFMSDGIRELAAGRSFEFPVAAHGAAWWMSRDCAVSNLMHAAMLDLQALRSQRVWLLPVLHASMSQIVDALASMYGESVRSQASYAPQENIQAQFANFPPLQCPRATAAGFRNDGTLQDLLRRALAH